MENEKPQVGEIKPLYQQVGWKVCKKTSDNVEDQEWIPVEKESDAEIVSFVLKYKPKDN